MSESDRIAEIEDLTVQEFKKEIRNTIEILAASLNIGLLGEDLKITLERWLQLDLWKKVEKSK